LLCGIKAFGVPALAGILGSAKDGGILIKLRPFAA
jgi:hypothetical protein